MWAPEFVRRRTPIPTASCTFRTQSGWREITDKSAQPTTLRINVGIAKVRANGGPTAIIVR